MYYNMSLFMRIPVCYVAGFVCTPTIDQKTILKQRNFEEFLRTYMENKTASLSEKLEENMKDIKSVPLPDIDMEVKEIEKRFFQLLISIVTDIVDQKWQTRNGQLLAFSQIVSISSGQQKKGDKQNEFPRSNKTNKRKSPNPVTLINKKKVISIFRFLEYLDTKIIESGGIRIIVIDKHDERIEICVMPDCTVIGFKESILLKKGLINPNYANLHYYNISTKKLGTNLWMDHGRLIAYYGIGNGSVVYVKLTAETE